MDKALIDSFRAFEKSMVKIHKNSPEVLWKLYLEHKTLGLYETYNCRVYIITSPILRMAHTYKLGCSSQSLTGLVSRYKGILPDGEIVFSYPGLYILEHLVLSHPSIVINREKHTSRKSERITMHFSNILAAFQSIVGHEVRAINPPLTFREHTQNKPTKARSTQHLHAA